MPTGYTSDIYNGKSQTFEEFALSCAHAFLFNMREAAADAPIPDYLELSDYHVRELAKAKKDLALYRKMSLADAKKIFDKDFKTNQKENKQSLRKNGDLFFRYHEMLTKVERWNPPKALAGLKKFMEEQLSESIKFDCSAVTSTPKPKDDDDENPRDVKSWLKAKKENSQNDIEYHSRELKKEQKAAEDYKVWVKALKTSIK